MLRSCVRASPLLPRVSSNLPRPSTLLPSQLRSGSCMRGSSAYPVLRAPARFSSSTPNPPPRSRGKTLLWLAVGGAVCFTAYTQLKPERDEQDMKQKDARFDTEKLFASKTTAELAFSWFILKMCSYDFLVEYGPRLLHWAEEHYLSVPAHWAMKHTFFKHFVAGETQEETLKTLEKLRKVGLGIVLDYSIESGSDSREEQDKVAEDIISTVHLAANDPQPFACLKVSGLTSFALLERLSQIVAYYNNAPKDMPIQWTEGDKKVTSNYTPRLLPSSPKMDKPPAPLTQKEKQELNELMARLDLICKESHKYNVSILFDAEQTYYQPAIDYMTLHFAKKYNKNTPIVYNTYQMYLKQGPDRMLRDIETAQKEGYLLGVKLVRGAYMHTERKRAKKMNYADPICSNIEETHHNYYMGFQTATQRLQNVALMIASHNENTVVDTIEMLRTLDADQQLKNSRIQYAQLYGMGDHLSFLLLQSGYHVFKYVPYGPVEHVLPYLVRRMQENRGFIGSASSTERRLLWRELRRRLGFGTGTGAGTSTSPSAPATGTSTANPVPSRGTL